MAHYADAPPGYDYVVPPRVFATLPNSGPRPFLGDDRSLFAPGTPDWTGSRTNLVQSVQQTHEDSNSEQHFNKVQGWRKKLGVGNKLGARKQQDSKPDWKPVSLRAPFLLAVILISITLVVVLQLLLIQSQRNGGIIFAKDINALPLKKSFTYLYLPTIIAVIYGFMWNWIDLDVRRIEPFLQLAKEEGATGRDSLLLHYPVDFLASVPVKAMKSGHWTVFTASIATVFVFWGITPTQSGIFATSTLNKTMEIPTVQSTAYLSLSQQNETLSASSAHSVSSIMWLNETLQPFMTRDYLLAPFGPVLNSSTRSIEGNFTGLTRKYSVDVNCETPLAWTDDGAAMVNSSWGCRLRLPPPPATYNNSDDTKIFEALYMGYFNDDGLADYYLSSGACPPSQPRSFFVQMSKALIAPSTSFNLVGNEQPEYANVTNLFCRASYYFQEVEATIRLPDKAVLAHKSLGPTQPLPTDIFNASNFEAAMNMGHERFRVRTDFPTTDWPSQTAFLMGMPLKIGFLPKMAPFALGASQLPLNEYLKPANLANSYQSAYRLLFARQMTSVLSHNMDSDSVAAGLLRYRVQAIVLVPAFTYIVESLLILSALFATMILYDSSRRASKLRSDPATIAAIMSLAAEDNALLSKLMPMDQASEKDLELFIRNRRFRLQSTPDLGSACRLQLVDLRGNEPIETFNDELQANKRQQTMQLLREADGANAGVVNGIQPTELKAKIGLTFLVTQIALLAVIAGLYVKIQNDNGLALPSRNRFLRQLLENYLPTAVGTLIEPVWVVLNRHLCFLQPFDELRESRKGSDGSLNVEYSSLPPQMAIVKAWSNGNILLGTVCTMALLANGLAVALSGLFFENTVSLMTPASLTPRYQTQFLPLDGAAAPFVAAKGQSRLTNNGLLLEPLYIANSNRTANTPLPPWTDSNHFYFPFEIASKYDSGSPQLRAVTPAIGARVACEPISARSRFDVIGNRKFLTSYSILSSGNLTVSLVAGEKEIMCVPKGVAEGSNLLLGSPTGPSAYEFLYALDGLKNALMSDAQLCREHFAAGWIRSAITNGVLTANETGEAVPQIIASHQETIAICRSTLLTGTADVLVGLDGHVEHVYSQNLSTDGWTEILSTTPSDLIGQTNQIILDAGNLWHNDSLPSDFVNYLIEQATNSSTHLDPNSPPPAMDNIIPPLAALYSQLFATLVGRNMDVLLKPKDSEVRSLQGYMVQPTIRIFMSKPMFIAAETILLLYIIVTIVLYLQRPWKILCRMPTSIASIIAFFAASHAITDFRGTAELTKIELGEHVASLGSHYGFGTFIGTDGKTHIGVEKYPFLAPLMKTRGLKRGNPGDSRGSTQNEWMSRFAQWKSGKVREGGWM